MAKKTPQEIKKTVDSARKIVQHIYTDDPRLKAKNLTSDSGIVKETDIVFQEVLRYLLNQ